jgi:hypothetical protein
MSNYKALIFKVNLLFPHWCFTKAAGQIAVATRFACLRAHAAPPWPLMYSLIRIL